MVGKKRGLRDRLLLMMSLFIIFGAMIEIAAGHWDGMTHVTSKSDEFWSIQHTVLYSGVAMMFFSSLLGVLFVLKRFVDRGTAVAIMLIIAGPILQVASGYMDFQSHEKYGVDAFLSTSHFMMFCSTAISSVGGFLLVPMLDPRHRLFLGPLSIAAIIASSFWVIVSISVFLSPFSICMPVTFVYGLTCSVM